ncbi:SMKW-like protein [Mya arenaria]|uniref:SMKW-like protein n=1 Tax=Mya arenaria TaxID=6604 RepID=A0ABY7EX66_MYAAR|nr:putative sperm motility kinase W [Mya arenaria]WAR14542.1 SMKW-like protein [Mya arenaria]
MISNSFTQEACTKHSEDYEVTEMIDYGSFGDIFKVKTVSDNKIYAMKQIKYRGLFQNDPYIMNEIYCLTHLKHKNIICLHEIIIDTDEIHIIMEYAANESLDKFLVDHKDMEFHHRYKLFSQTLQGVMYCHDMDVAHRDLTPSNILLTKDMVVKIADFGLAVKCFTESGEPVYCTDYIGHTSYLAPEVLSQNPFLPKPADLWSLGITLLFLIFYSVPYNGLQEDVLKDILRDTWTTFVESKSKTAGIVVKQDIVNIVESCLRVKVNSRPSICDLIREWDNIAPDSLLDTETFTVGSK